MRSGVEYSPNGKPVNTRGGKKGKRNRGAGAALAARGSQALIRAKAPAAQQRTPTKGSTFYKDSEYDQVEYEDEDEDEGKDRVDFELPAKPTTVFARKNISLGSGAKGDKKPRDPRRRPLLPTLLQFVLGLAAVIFGLGVVLTYLANDIQILGAPAFRWGILVGVGALAALAAQILIVMLLWGIRVATTHAVLYALDPYRVPAIFGIASAVTIGLLRPVLGNNVRDSAVDAVREVFVAVIVVAVIFALTAMLIQIAEMRIMHAVYQPIREARALDRAIIAVSAYDEEHGGEGGVVVGARNPVTQTLAELTRAISGVESIAVFQVAAAAQDMSERGYRTMGSDFPETAELVDSEKAEAVNATVAKIMRLSLPEADPQQVTRERLTGVLCDKGNVLGGIAPFKADFVFDVLDIECKGVLSEASVREAVLDLVEQRTNLLTDISGHRLFVRVGGQMLHIIASVAAILVLLSAFGVDIIGLLVPASALFFGFSFAFARPMSDFVQGCHFVFIRRPYEIGDRVMVNSGDEMYVVRIGILTTTFLSTSGYEVSISNSTVAQGKLFNYRRSSYVYRVIYVSVTNAIRPTDISGLESELNEFCRGYPKLLDDSVRVYVDQSSVNTNVVLKVVVKVRTRWDKKIAYSRAHSLVSLAVCQYLAKNKIRWGANYKIFNTQVDHKPFEKAKTR
jgi:small-conductance mechanosensitive channel